MERKVSPLHRPGSLRSAYRFHELGLQHEAFLRYSQGSCVLMPPLGAEKAPMGR